VVQARGGIAEVEPNTSNEALGNRSGIDPRLARHWRKPVLCVVPPRSETCDSAKGGDRPPLRWDDAGPPCRLFFLGGGALDLRYRGLDRLHQPLFEQSTSAPMSPVVEAITREHWSVAHCSIGGGGGAPGTAPWHRQPKTIRARSKPEPPPGQ
jgi:hypothetical protein